MEAWDRPCQASCFFSRWAGAQMGGFQGWGEAWGSTEATWEMALQTETVRYQCERPELTNPLHWSHGGIFLKLQVLFLFAVVC